MPTPEDAERIPTDIDPHEIVDAIADCDGILQDDEAIGTFELIWTAEALAAADVDFLTGARDMALVSINGGADRGVRFWPDFVDPDDAAFDGDGVGLPFEITVETTSSPSRTRQRTGILWARNR